MVRVSAYLVPWVFEVCVVPEDQPVANHLRNGLREKKHGEEEIKTLQYGGCCGSHIEARRVLLASWEAAALHHHHATMQLRTIFTVELKGQLCASVRQWGANVMLHKAARDLRVQLYEAQKELSLMKTGNWSWQ